MFKNATKKLLAVGLVFSLCVPCCFVSAQSFDGNGMNIPRESPANQQNRAVDEDFLRRVLNIRIPAELLNQQTQRQPSALEDLWAAFSARLQGQGRLLRFSGDILVNSADEFARTFRSLYSDPWAGYHALISMGEKMGFSFEEAWEYVIFAVRVIYNMDEDTYRDFLLRTQQKPGATYTTREQLEILASVVYFAGKYRDKYPN